MKRSYLLLALLLAIIQSQAQIITGAEYFFDTDPGTGNGTALTVSPGDSILLNTTIPTSALSIGFHKLYIRVQNANGNWSLQEGRSFYIRSTAIDTIPQLLAAEYFFDTDPGVGNGTAFTVVPGDSIDLNTTVPTASLSNGFHTLYVRTQNTDGKWSLYEGRTIYIHNPVNAVLSQLESAEYFYDTDPGFGNGTPFTTSTGDSLIINAPVPTASLGAGFHTLYVRAKNTNGEWSLYEGRTIYIESPPDSNLFELTNAEYFFDTDPGQGNATAFTVASGDSIIINGTVPTTALTDGFHEMYVRAKNSANRWSLLEGRSFFVQTTPDPNVPILTDAEYFFDSDPGIGLATVLPVIAGDSIDANFTIPQSLALGNHSLFLRVKNSIGAWSLYEGREFIDSIVGIHDLSGNVTQLLQNEPNPFSSTTTVYFYMHQHDRVQLCVTDLLGHVIKEVINESMTAGKHLVTIDDQLLQSGYYVYQLRTSDFTGTWQMILMK